MEYDSTILKIHSLLKFGIRPGLDRIRKLLNLMENPQERLKFVHVAGTNGKGSICNMISESLQTANYKVGLFISPYVVDFCERIQVNSQQISKKELTRISDEIFDLTEKMAAEGEQVTEFEFITALAFKYFAQSKCDIVVLETGLGGRLDSTNVISCPLISVITSISNDHAYILGDSIEEIASEKAGIIKENGKTVFYPIQNEAARKVIYHRCKAMKNSLIVPDINMLKTKKSCKDKNQFIYKGKRYSISLAGDHQVINAITSICTIETLNNMGFNVSCDDILLGLSSVKFPARLELFSRKPYIYLDGAHNEGGANALKEFINEHFKDINVTLILGMLKDKNIDKFISIVSKSINKIIVVDINNERAMQKEALHDKAKKHCDNVFIAKDKKEALKLALCKLGESDPLIIAGSLYLAGEIRPVISETLKDYGITNA